MSTYDGVVLFKKPGVDIADDDLREALANNTTSFGMSMVSSDKGQPFVLTLRMKQSAWKEPFQFMKDSLTKLKEKKVVVTLGTMPGDFKKESLQPYPLVLNAGGHPVIVGFLSGQVEKHADGVDPYLNLYEELLQPKVAKIAEAAGHDISKIGVDLRSKITKAEMSGLLGNTQLTLMLANNDVITQHSQSAAGLHTNWGWVSRIYSEPNVEMEAVTEEAPVEEPNELEKIFGTPEEEAPAEVKAMPAKAKPDAASMATKVAAVQDKSGVSTKGLTQQEIAEGFVMEMRTPDKDMSNRQTKKWYESHLGTIPKNWQERFAIPVKVKRAPGPIRSEQPEAEPIKDFKTAAEKLKTTTAIPQKPVRVEATGKVITPAKASVPIITPKPAEKPPVQAEPEIREPLPLVGAEEKKLFLDHYLPGKQVALLDRKGDAIFDPRILKSFEEETPTFCELAGLPNLESTFMWTTEDIMEMIKDHPALARRYLFDLRHEVILAWQQAHQKSPTPLKTQTIPGKPARAVA